MTPEKFKKMTLRLIAKALKKSMALRREAQRDNHLSKLLPHQERSALRSRAMGKARRALRIKAFTIRLAQARGIDLNKSGQGGTPGRKMMMRANDNHSLTVKEDTPCATTWQ